MTVFAFSTLTNRQRLAYDPAVDALNLDVPGATAANVRFVQVGGSVSVTFGTKVIFLDGVSLAQLNSDLFGFAGGGDLLVGDGQPGRFDDFLGADYSGVPALAGGILQIQGLEGADLTVGGALGDLLVGNGALTLLTHVSRVGPTGAPTASFAPTISADGRFVAFEGGWTQFGSTSNSATDVLVKDMTTGAVTNEHKSATGVAGLSGSGDAVISADGGSLAFVSTSQLLSPTGTPGNTVFVASTTSAAIEAVSRSTGGALGNLGGAAPDLSGDGRFVVFESRSSNLVAGGSITFEDIFLKDRGTGALTRISTSIGGTDGNGESRFAKISADGRYVVFQSAASNLTAGDTNARIDIFLKDRSTGTLINLTEATAGQFDSLRPDVAFADGYAGVVVFDTAKALEAGDTNNAIDVYAYDIATGVFTRVSETASGGQVALASQDASISGDGRFVVFRSFSDALVPGDTNGFADVFVKDVFTGAIALVSRTAAAQANQASGAPQISLGGDWIVFESGASSLAPTDGNGTLSDVHRVSNPLLFDTLRGGAGDDTYVIARKDVIVELPGGGIDRVESTINYTLGANLENLTLTGRANLLGVGNAASNVITGNAGNNRLLGQGGNDTLNGGLGNDTLEGSIGNDRLVGSDGLDSLVGGTGNDNLVGGDGNDTLIGGDGNDTIDGGEGSNWRDGGAGDDLYIITSNSGPISDSAGIDTQRTSFASFLYVDFEILELVGAANIAGTGNRADNRIIGNAGDNQLRGFLGDDTIEGGAGDDRLRGEAGLDRLVGGTGVDVFVLDLFNPAQSSDIFVDFSPVDDQVEIQTTGRPVGDGDLLVEGGVVRAAAGGFAVSAELVIFTSNAGALDAAGAAARIGSATSAYAVGATRIFAIDNGASSAVFLFTAADANALVSASELTLLATLQGTPSTTLADYVFN
jgi:Ca2+-binding RTX toxin-like protein